MKKYIINRIAFMVAVLIGASILSFVLIALSDSNPAEIIAAKNGFIADEAKVAELTSRLGLDKPIYLRYFIWLKSLFTGDMGTSLATFNPVAADIAAKLPVTLSLMGMALIWIVVISLPLSLLCARFKNSIFDHITRGITILGISIPTFWLGFILLLIFAVKLHLLPVVSKGDISSYILPSFALALPTACSLIRIFRSSLLTEMSADYFGFAKSRGLTKTRIVITHTLRNALPPVIVLLCQYIGYLMAGSAVIESIFSLNGIGSYLLLCITSADDNAAATCIIIIAAVFTVSNLAADIINKLLCPWIVRESNA